MHKRNAESSAEESRWSPLLDEVKRRHQLSSDAALGRLLGVTRSFISAVRSNRKNVSLELGLSVFRHLDRAITHQDLVLFLPLRGQRPGAAEAVMLPGGLSDGQADPHSRQDGDLIEFNAGPGVRVQIDAPAVLLHLARTRPELLRNALAAAGESLTDEA